MYLPRACVREIPIHAHMNRLRDGGDQEDLLTAVQTTTSPNACVVVEQKVL